MDSLQRSCSCAHGHVHSHARPCTLGPHVLGPRALGPRALGALGPRALGSRALGSRALGSSRVRLTRLAHALGSLDERQRIIKGLENGGRDGGGRDEHDDGGYDDDRDGGRPWRGLGKEAHSDQRRTGQVGKYGATICQPAA